MTIIRNLLVKAGLSERRKDGRVTASGLEVSYTAGWELKRARVKDISATGLFLFTDEQLALGTSLELTLHKRSLLERDSRPQVQLRARCVRVDEDGMGLSFADDPAQAATWSKSMAMAAVLLAENHPVRLFRATKAIAFLLRICPAAEGEILPLMADLSSGRAEKAIDIVLQAEELLVARAPEAPAGTAPNVILRILDYGSKTTDERVQKCWAGLLASATIAGTREDSMVRYIVLTSRLDGDHVAVFTAACARAMRAGWQRGFVFPFGLQCSVEEIRRVSGIRNPAAVERILNHLHQLGLMEKTARPLGCAQLEQVNIIPTGLALKLYARYCVQAEPSEAQERSALEMAS